MTRKLNVNRNNCWILIMKSQVPGPFFDKWQPVSSDGFRIIFASQHDANEGRLFLASSFIKAPPGVAVNEEAYEKWISQFLQMQPYQASGHGEMWFHEWMRGKSPSAQEFADMLKHTRPSW